MADRIQRVNAVRLEQVRLSGDDVSYLAQWLRRYVLSHVDEIDAREYEESSDRTLALAFIKWVNKESPEIPEPTIENYEELAARLGIQRAFETNGVDEAERREFVADQIYHYLFESSRRGRSRVMYIDPSERMKFFASDSMPAEAKKGLDTLDLTQQNRLLTHYYLLNEDPNWWKRLGGSRSGRGRSGRGDGNRGDGDRGRGDGGRGDGGRSQRPGGGGIPEFGPLEDAGRGLFENFERAD